MLSILKKKVGLSENTERSGHIKKEHVAYILRFVVCATALYTATVYKLEESFF